MIHCVKCGSELADAEAVCAACGWDKEVSREGLLRTRSDGGSFLGFGWCGIAFGLVASLIGMFPTGGGTYVSGYGMTPPTYHVGWFTIGALLFNVGLLLLLAGFVIRAIWFLPGPEYKPVPGARARRPERPVTSPLTRPGGEGAQV